MPIYILNGKEVDVPENEVEQVVDEEDENYGRRYMDSGK